MNKRELSKLRLFFGCASFLFGLIGVFCGSPASCILGVLAGCTLIMFLAAMGEKED